MQIRLRWLVPRPVSHLALAFAALAGVACSSTQTSRPLETVSGGAAQVAVGSPQLQLQQQLQAIVEREHQVQRQLADTADGEQRFALIDSLSSAYFNVGMVIDSMRVREQIVDDPRIPAGRRSLTASDLAADYALEDDHRRSEHLIDRAKLLAQETTSTELETLPLEPAYAYYAAEAQLALRDMNRQEEALLKRREIADLAWHNLNDPTLSENRHRAAANELLSITAELVQSFVQNNQRDEALSYANEIRWDLDNLPPLKPTTAQRATAAVALALALASNDDYEAALKAVDEAVDGYRRAGVEPWSTEYAFALRIRLIVALALGRIGDYRADADGYEIAAAVNPVEAHAELASERESLIAAARGQWSFAETDIAAAKADALRWQGPESPIYKYRSAMQMLYLLDDPSSNVTNADIAAYAGPILGNDEEGNASPTRGAYAEDGALGVSIDLLMQGKAHNETLGFRIAELFHMNATGGAMSDGAARLAATTPQLRALVEQERQLTYQENDAHRALGQQTPRGTEDQLHALRKQIAAQFPVYRQLTAPVIPTPDALGGVLREGEIYLNLYAGRDASYVFVVHPGGELHAVMLTATRADLRKMVVALRAGFDAGRPPDKPGDPAGFDLAAASGLYQSLIAPIEDDLRGVTTVYIATSGILASVPFDALLTSPADNLAQAAWWIDKVTPVRIPSASALMLARSLTATHASEPFIAFADPSFDGDDTPASTLQAVPSAVVAARAFPLDKTTRSLDYHRVAPLPETLDEARAIASALGAPDQSVIWGAHAARSTVMKTDLSNDRVVLFATHGIVPGEVPGWRKAGLALAYEGNGLEDSVLTVDDIVTLRLNADWVVLSACKTGLATGNAGDAISELSRAFFASGARSMLVTQWAVESRSAAAITTGAFKTYAADASLSKADALVHAERDMLHGKYGLLYRHPYFWAAYILTGDAAR
ncbi:hypothetical protein LMG27952_04891 [Paraburkholderia hiiakae]|uniref:CHAT domain-containing protein n=2 Tax=Paraburkholderia hiiakae TaxID=1081782 RepID=A0ABN7I751_9BURK|nr:hypothetical protein LMG27952_04891 [Paraburkholderia hiiakae]